MKCYKLPEGIKSKESKQFYSIKEIKELLLKSDNINNLSKQQITIFDIESLNKNTSENLKPDFTSGFKFLEEGNDGKPITKINSSVLLYPIYNEQNRINELVKLLERIKGEPLSLSELTQIQLKITRDKLKGTFVKNVLNPLLEEVVSAKTEEDLNKVIRNFILNCSPFYIDESNLVQDKSNLPDNHPIKMNNFSEKHQEILFKNSGYFRNKNEYYSDFNKIQQNLTSIFNKLRSELKLTEDYLNVKTIVGKYLHSQTSISKIGMKMPLYREIDNGGGNITKDLFMFATGSGEYSDWDLVKKLRLDYGLGLARTILISNSVEDTPLNPIGLNLITSAFDNGSFFDSFKITNNKLQRNLSTHSSELVHGGEIYNQLKRFIKVTSQNVISTPNIDNIEIDNLIKKLTNGAWIPQSVHKTNKEHIKNKILENKLSNGKYLFRKYKGVNVIEEEISLNEIDSKVEGYIQELELNKHQYTLDIIKYCSETLDKIQAGVSINSLDVFGERSSKVQTFVNRIFEQYITPDHVVLVNEVLVNNGIVGFINTKTKQIDFITTTIEDLNLVHLLQTGESKNDNGTTIYGGYFKNDTAYSTFGEKALPSTTYNLEFLKVLSICNTIPDVLSDYKIGNILVINTITGLSKYSDESTYQGYSKLLNFLGIENKITKNKFVSQDIKWFNLVKQLLESSENVKLLKTKNKIDNILPMGVEDQSIIIKQTEDLRKEIETAYPQFKQLLISDTIDFDTPEKKIYAIVCGLELYYKGISLENESGMTKYNLDMSLFWNCLSSIYSYNQSRVSKDNMLMSGFLLGFLLTGSSNVPSENLQKINNIIRTAITKVRTEVSSQASKLHKLTSEYLDKKLKSTVSRYIIGDPYSIYKNLLVKKADGTLDSRMLIKNPYDNTNDLENIDREYLKQILWEINKFRLPDLKREVRSLSYNDSILNIDSVISAINSERYFELPLKRGGTLSRIHSSFNGNITEYVSSIYNTVKMNVKDMADSFDPRNLDKQSRLYYDTKKENYNKYPNLYITNLNERATILDQESTNYWELDLDYLALDMAFLAAKSEIFTNTLGTVRGFTTLLKYFSFTTGTDISKELEYLENHIKVTIFNEPLVDKEAEKPIVAVKSLRKVSSILLLSARPALLAKELTVGLMRSMNIALTNIIKGGEKFSFKEIFSAYATVLGHAVDKTGNLIESNDKDIAEFTFMNALNNEYGLANMDINSIVDKYKTNRFGLNQGSKWLFWTSTSGDFVNRLVLLVADMKKSGIFEAHTVKDGLLVYDMSKDKRFEIYYKHKNNSEYKNNPEFIKQKALYLAMMDEFIKEGFKNKNGELLKYGDDLPRAYTPKQNNAIKEYSDTIYGCYDHELKNQLEHKTWGIILLQYKTYWSGAMRRYFAMPGTKTAKGHYVHLKTEDGKPLFKKPIYNEFGVTVNYELVTENPDNEYVPAYGWEGDFMEGMMVSLIKTIRDCGYLATNVFGLTNYSVKFERERIGNAVHGILDLLIGLYLYKLIKFIWSLVTGKDDEDIKEGNLDASEKISYKAVEILGKAASEFNIDLVLLINSFTPTFVSTQQKLANKFIKTISDGDYGLELFIIDNVSGIRDFAEVQIIN